MGDARHDIIDRIAALARKHEAPYVIVAGDVFDSDMPSKQVLRHSVHAMRRHKAVQWLLMPGNHDFAKPGGLWDELAVKCPKNIVLLLEETPVEVASGVFVLPAPCRDVKDPGRDRTEWMEAAEIPEGSVRIGVAHGAVRDFGSDRGHSASIDPQRVDQSELDYLAMGDWHSTVEVTDQCWYSGSPEPDRFAKRPSGQCLVVEVSEHGAPVQIETVRIGRFRWLERMVDVLPEVEPEPILAEILEGMDVQRDWLVRLKMTGRLSLAARAAWEHALEEWGPALAHWTVDWSAVETVVEAEDLDCIGTGGVLRAAADELRAESEDASISESERDAAGLALKRLYAWAQEGS